MKNIVSIVFLFLLGLTPWTYASEAKETLEVSLNEAFFLIKNKELSEDERYTFVYEEISAVFSFHHIARLSVGRGWKSFSDEQKKEFVQVFSEFLFNTYYKRIKQLKDSEETLIDFLKGRELGKNRIEISTLAHNKNGEIPIHYRMIFTDKGWRVYDVVIEGISLVSNYRSQFSEILRKDTPLKLINTIKEKNASAKNNK